MNRLLIKEKRKKVKLALKYINTDCELERLIREIPMIRRQLECLKRKNKESEEYKRCKASFRAKKRRKDSLLIRRKKLSTQFCLKYGISLELPEAEKIEIARQVLKKNSLLRLKAQGGWPEEAYNKMSDDK